MNSVIATLSLLVLWNLDVPAQVAVIGHKDVPGDSLTSSQLLDFYSAEKRVWKNGSAVIVFDLKPKVEFKANFYKFLGKSSSRMKSIWMVNMLSGEGDPPESLKTEEEMLKKVAETEGALGFVRKSIVNGSVKVLTVIKPEQK